MTDELFQQFSKEFAQLEHYPKVILEMSALEAWCLLGQIQLACRHPQNVGPSREVAESFARKIQHVLAITPALQTVAERGWDPAYDQEDECDRRSDQSQ